MKKALALLLAVTVVCLTACSTDKDSQATTTLHTADIENSTSEINRTTLTSRQTTTTATEPETEGTTKKSDPDPKPIDPETGVDEELDEPAVPVEEFDMKMADQGIENRKAMIFFKTISTNPVYYHYVHHAANSPETDIQIALNFDRSYLKIEYNGDISEYLSTGNQNYYRLDRKENTATPVSAEEAMGDEISMASFEQLYDNAQDLYYVGTGKAKFNDEDCEFEEYTQNGDEFIRYYFHEDHIVGHRLFSNGKMVSEVLISSLTNTVDDTLFEIPDTLTVVTSNDESNP